MAHTVWRIAVISPNYAADDLSGKGADKTGGRWNRKGTPLIYCSHSIALACLETMVHLSGAEPLPLNRFLIRIEMPLAAWDTRTIFDSAVHAGWNEAPAGRISLEWGSTWAAGCRSLVAEVPSIVVPEEFNVLINPRHPDAGKLIAKKVRRWTYDSRLTN
jgi:RES domain-containing protein